MCFGGCGKEKSINHLFLECEFFWKNLDLCSKLAGYLLCSSDWCLHACHAILGVSFVQEGYLSLISSNLVVMYLGHLEGVKLSFFSTKNCHLIICLIRSSFILGGNWRLKTQHIFWILIFYGLIRQLV